MGDDLNVSPGGASDSRQIRLASLIFVAISFNLESLSSNIAVIRVCKIEIVLFSLCLI